MKNIILTVVAICTLSVVLAQKENPTDSQERMEKFNEVKKHEVSLDVLAAVGGLGINPRYEYVLGRYSGVGVDLNIGIYDNSDNNNIESFSFTPYYRQYFFSKEDYGAKGFYGEGFVKFYTYEVNQGFINDGITRTTVSEDFFETAIGVGIGWKWVSDSGFLIDIGFGIGRNLGIADDASNQYSLPEVTGRGGVNFGWRF